MNLETRFARLESSVHKWKAACVAVVVLAVVGIIIMGARPGSAQQAAQPAADVVRTKKLVVVNDDGKAVVIITADKTGAGAVVVRSKDGGEGVGILGDEKLCGIILKHANGRDAVSMLTNGGKASIETYSAEGQSTGKLPR